MTTRARAFFLLKNRIKSENQIMGIRLLLDFLKSDSTALVLKQILHKKKSIFHATTGIPNSSSYCCCPLDDHLQEAGPSFWQPWKGMKNAFLRPFTMRCNVFWVSKNQISMKKKIKIFTFAYGQGRGNWPPPLKVSLTVKYSLFFYALSKPKTPKIRMKRLKLV